MKKEWVGFRNSTFLRLLRIYGLNHVRILPWVRFQKLVVGIAVWIVLYCWNWICLNTVWICRLISFIVTSKVFMSQIYAEIVRQFIASAVYDEMKSLFHIVFSDLLWKFVFVTTDLYFSLKNSTQFHKYFLIIMLQVDSVCSDLSKAFHKIKIHIPMGICSSSLNNVRKEK